MSKVLKRSLSGIAALASLASGLLWKISADVQIQAASTHSEELVRKLLDLSAHENLWAACCSVVSGLILAVVMSLE